MGHRLAKQLDAAEANSEPVLQRFEAGDLIIAEAGQRGRGRLGGPTATGLGGGFVNRRINRGDCRRHRL